jgi:hypothetical protein
MMKNDNASAARHDLTGELREEERKIREMRCLVDITTMVIAQGNISVLEACALIRLTRQHVLELFPDKEAVFDLIYRPRFARIIQERLKKSPAKMN